MSYAVEVQERPRDLSRGPVNEETRMVRKVAVSSFLGNFIEWFDYASYSYFATTIATVFFPASDRTVALMQTFGVFALSFILRPVGALFWGSFGDKHGRKGALSASILLMSGASFLIGCLPSYEVIGLAAPALLLLLRMVQSFSASGEYAGAATFLGEYSPTSRRGLYCSLIPASTAIGLLAGSTIASIMTANLSGVALAGWGWRIPFLLAGPLGVIVHYIRTSLADSPVYARMNEKLQRKEGTAVQGTGASPLRMLFRNHTRELLISFGASMLNAVGFPFDGDREGLRRLLSDFDGLLGRIAAAPFAPGDPDAEELSRRIQPIRAAALHDVIGEVREALQYNANCPLTAALLGARLKTVMEARAL